MDNRIEQVNSWNANRAEAEFLKCCGAQAWARAMAERRPFKDAESMFEDADNVFELLSDEDWMTAFRAHPKIGEQKAGDEQSEAALRWSAQEQSQAVTAPVGVLQALAAANREYEERFGFIFIVCATGRTADQMLSIIRQRITNPPAAEFRIAAKEQKRITQLRLQKLLDSLASS